MNWSDLSMSRKNELMQIYLKNGITSLDEMKKHYNSFAEGGYTSPKYPPFDNTPQRTDIADNEKRARGKWHVENASGDQQSVITKAFNEAKSKGLTTEQAYEYVADVAKQYGWSKEGSNIGERTIKYRALPNINSSDNNVSQRYFTSEPISEEEYQRRVTQQAIRQSQQSGTGVIYDSDEKAKRDNPNNPRTPFEPHPATPKELDVAKKGLRFLQPFDPTGITGIPDALDAVGRSISGNGNWWDITTNVVGAMPVVGKVNKVKGAGRFTQGIIDTGPELLGAGISRISPRVGRSLQNATAGVQNITAQPAEKVMQRMLQNGKIQEADRFSDVWNLGASAINWGRLGEDFYDLYTEDPLVQKIKKGFQFAEGGSIDDPPYTRFLNTLPDNLKNSGNEYNMRRYWELNGYPKDFNEGIQLGMFTKQDDGYHANSVAFNPVTNSYEFMKNRNHPTYNMELDWYYSDDPEAVEFRKNYKYTPGIGMIPDQYTPRRFDTGGPIDPRRFFGIATPEVTDNNIYQSRIGMLPEVNVTAKGDPRKVNNDYYKAHAAERAAFQDKVARRVDQGWVPKTILGLAALPFAAEGVAAIAPTIGRILTNPLVDTALTTHGAITAPKNIREGIDEIKEGNYGKGALDLGLTALDVAGGVGLLKNGVKYVNKAIKGKKFSRALQTNAVLQPNSLTLDDKRFISDVAGYSGYDIGNAIIKLRERFGNDILTKEAAEKIKSVPDNVGRRWLNNILADYGAGLNAASKSRDYKRTKQQVDNLFTEKNPLIYSEFSDKIKKGKIPKQIQNEVDAQVLPRLLLNKDRQTYIGNYSSIDEFINNYEDALNADYYNIDNSLYHISSPNSGGMYIPTYNRILLPSDAPKRYAIHETRHAIDNHVGLMPNEEDLLKVYGSISPIERVSSNAEIRSLLLDQYNAANYSISNQNKIIDEVNDDELFGLMSKSNKYFQDAINDGTITKKSIPQIKQALKYVGILSSPLLFSNEYSKGGKIHIKPENRGKFTALKKRTGHSASWFKENGTPAQKKMAVFELNSKKWRK